MRIKSGLLVGLSAVIILGVIGAALSLFTVNETDQVIIIQLGKYVRTVKEPGLHIKIPLIQTVYRFDKRILKYDATAAKIITQDKKHLVIDDYARWKIVDPLKFYQTVRTEVGAQARLDDIVFSNLRRELALHDLSDIVSDRGPMMDKVTRQSDKKARHYGIQVIDVRIKRADLPQEVEASVYARMRAERERIAKKYRAEGQESSIEIKAVADKERTILLAGAYQEAEKTKGEGDAQAITIYAGAYDKDPGFYAFLRTLEAYKKALGKGTTVVFSMNSEFFKYLSPDEITIKKKAQRHRVTKAQRKDKS